MTTDEILLGNVVKDENGCWLWNRAKDWRGYGKIKVGGRMFGVHRLAYRLFKGEIPEDLCVCHSCNNKLCLNPDHLYLASRENNMTHAHRDGLVPSKRPGYHRLSRIETLEIGNAEGSLRDVATRYNIATSTVSRSRATAKLERLF